MKGQIQSSYVKMGSESYKEELLRLKREGEGYWIFVLLDDGEGPSVWGQISVGGKRLRETRFRCP